MGQRLKRLNEAPINAHSPRDTMNTAAVRGGFCDRQGQQVCKWKSARYVSAKHKIIGIKDTVGGFGCVSVLPGIAIRSR
jgi:hypothetical protein